MTFVDGLRLLALVNSTFVLFFGLRASYAAMRSGRLSHWLLAAYWVTSGSAYVVFLLPPILDLGEQTGAYLLWAFAVLVRVPVICLCLFTWRVFRPDKVWAAVLAIFFIGVYVLWNTLNPTAAPGGLFYWLGWSSAILPAVWTAVEAFRYFGVAKRRLAIGLTDAIGANRFFLFGLWACQSAAFSLNTSIYSLMPLEAVLRNLMAYGLGMTISWLGVVAVWLLFYPPDWYTSWVESAHPGAPQPSSA